MQFFKKIIADWIRYLGIFLLLIFSTFIVILSVTQRNANNSNNFLGVVASYSAFVENWFYDLRTDFLYDHDKKDANVLVAAIDEESLQKLGRWPWSRTKIAQIVDKLGDFGTKVIVFDIIFAEPEGDPKLPNSPDQKFANSIQNFQKNGGKAILSYSVVTQESEHLKEIPTELYFSVIDGGTQGHPIPPLNYVSKENFPIQTLVNASPVFGFLDNEPDRDGVFRHAKILADIDNTSLPSVGMAMFKNFFQTSKEHQVSIAPAPTGLGFELTIQAPEIKNSIKVPINDRGEMKIRFFGGEKNFDKISIHKILSAQPNDAAMKELLKNKVVIIGSTALGAYDLRHTPVDPMLPGLYIHANVFHMLQNQFFFKSDDAALPATIYILLIGTLLISALALFHSPLLDLGSSLGICGIVFYIDRKFYIPQGYVLSLFSSFFCFINIAIWSTFLNVYKEAKERKKVRGAFGRYVSPAIVKQMLANPEKLTLGGEKKEITMMFSDIRDFTTMSEKLSPQDLSGLLNYYMSVMTNLLFEYQGTLDKYIGDAMVCFWNAPLDIPDHAYLAVQSSLKMVETLPAVNKEFQNRKLPTISVGLGINTGEVSVGNMGSDKIFAYTALGDNMNLASRLEGLTKHYGVQLIISEFTYARLGDKKSEFKIRPLDMVQVKGKTSAVKIYEVIPSIHPLHSNQEALTQYCMTYDNYLARKFAESAQALTKHLELFPKDKAALYIKESCEDFIKNPPAADWQGVTIFKTK